MSARLLDTRRLSIPNAALLRVACAMLVIAAGSTTIPAVAGDIKSSRYDDIGGDDVIIAEIARAQDNAIAVASNGDIFVAVEYGNEAYIPRIQVYRSRDGGETWQEWGYFGADNEQHLEPCLYVTEGVADRCFLAYTRYTTTDFFGVEVAYVDLDSPTADWTRVAAISYDGMFHYKPSLTSDQENYADYNLYLVCAGHPYPPAEPADIWFARSTDQGQTFETPYIIGNLNTENTDYGEPVVAYGFGGYVHAAWRIRHHDEAFDEAIRYRRATGRAAGGTSAWSSLQSLTTTSDGMWDFRPQLVASPVSADVLLVYNRRIWTGSFPWLLEPPAVLCSQDHGATFPDATLLTEGLTAVYSALYQPSSDSWLIGGRQDDGAALQRASTAAPLDWSAPEVFSDNDGGERYIWWGRIALDPSRAGRIAETWQVVGGGEDPEVMFDAEWRADPGYPNLEVGFPRDLDHMPISPPAVVDLDDDGDLEIVYGSNDQRIQAFHHDGTPVTGWPVEVGYFLTDSPVAVGDLRGDGTLYVVAGTMGGLVVAYHTDGQLAPGWPFDSETGEPAYVSIGALGGDDPRSVVVAAGTRLTFASWQGVLPNGAFVRNHYFRTHIAPCAIGDINGDGISEVVCGPGNQVLAFRMCFGNTTLGRYLPADISDAITLVDLDLDGDMEIIAPTADGTLYAMYASGVNFPGSWPFVADTGTHLTSAAIAQCVGTDVPELAVGAREWSVHLLGSDGLQHAGFPVHTAENWDLFAAPIIGPVAGSVPDVVVADRGSLAWSWSDAGAVNPGFPRAVGEAVIDSPALGDLDQDGSTELVVLTANQLLVYDLNRPVAPPEEVWAMYSHDPQRTGCADCPEDVATPVANDGLTVTRVSFVPPNPNPMAGQGTFRFAIPARAVITLEIMDVRGRRVATVLKEERDPGAHVIGWNGRDHNGCAVAAGQYLARLQVRGDGFSQTLTRKLTLLR